MNFKSHILDGRSTGRFVVLNFDSDVIANTAMGVINLIITSSPNDYKREIHLQATPFIPNFQYMEYPKSSVVIHNLPTELNKSDLKELFSEFGKVLFTYI